MEPRSRLELRIHGWQANVAGPAALLRDLDGLYSANRPTSGQPVPAADATSSFDVELDVPHPGWQQITRAGVPLWSGQDASELLAYLEWGINRTAAEWLGQHYLLLHAGSVACHGRGLILPAPSGGGKTTLVAGLVAAGFDYLSDEVAMIEPDDLSLLPFAKSLCVKAGSREVLAPLYPSLASGQSRRRFGGEPVWYLPLPAGQTTPTPVTVRQVVLPSYQPGCPSALQPIKRSTALKRLLEQSFNLRAHGPSAVGRLVDLLRQADCYALSVGSLQPAVDILVKLARDA